MDWYRIRTLVIRYVFLYNRNPTRLLTLFFWPVMDILIWGTVTIYMLRVNSGVPALVTFLIGAIILWGLLYRAQQAIAVSFLEEVWSRNLVNIFIAPIRNREFVAATYLVAVAHSIVVVTVMVVLAATIYSFNLLSLGLGLIPLMANLLMMGWSLGLASIALLMRWGHGAQPLAWVVPILIQPLCVVFYPLSVLPPWLQPIACCIPATHAFEGMRQILRTGSLDPHYIWYASLLNLIYMAAAAWCFSLMFNQARTRGLLAKLSH